MNSMTGYGHAIEKTESYQLEVEIKSYNNRYLDLSHNISYLLSPYEQKIDEEIKKTVKRGHLDVSVRLKVLESHDELVIDEHMLGLYHDAFAKISEKTGIAPDFRSYTDIDGLLNLVKTDGAEIYEEALMRVLGEALDMLNASRKREGEGTYQDLLGLGKEFEASVAFISSRADEMTEYFRNVVLDRYNELLADKGLDEQRLMEEVTLMLVKYSINEEIKRLGVHLKEYFKLLESTEPVGKKLDFLCQEMNRESNTIASKSQMAEISQAVVRMKDSIENIREQIRNIE